jgi:hypothetical protein
VTAEKLVEGWADRTGEACSGRHVLAIQDRSEVKFPTTAQRRRGLGPVKKGNAYGVLVHAMIAVDAASGSCLGPRVRPPASAGAGIGRPEDRPGGRRCLEP